MGGGNVQIESRRKTRQTANLGLGTRPIISPVISELSMLSAMSGGSPQRDASDDGAPGAPAPAAQTSPLKKMIGLLRFKGWTKLSADDVAAGKHLPNLEVTRRERELAQQRKRELGAAQQQPEKRPVGRPRKHVEAAVVAEAAVAAGADAPVKRTYTKFTASDKQLAIDVYCKFNTRVAAGGSDAEDDDE